MKQTRKGQRTQALAVASFFFEFASRSGLQYNPVRRPLTQSEIIVMKFTTLSTILLLNALTVPTSLTDDHETIGGLDHLTNLQGARALEIISLSVRAASPARAPGGPT